MSSRIELHLDVTDDDSSVLDILAKASQLSRGKIKKAMKQGAVWIENQRGVKRIRRHTGVCHASDKIHLYYDEDIQNASIEEALLISDEGEYSIWSKPSGMYSQGTKWGDHSSIVYWVKKHLLPERPVYLLHRLDRATSGLILLAHTKRANQQFSRMFAERTIRKRYEAKVAHLSFQLSQLPVLISSEIDGREALTELLSVEEDTDGYRLSVEIKTGRKHQIRRHLAEMGMQVLGDRLYGDYKGEKDLQLRSVYLEFECPIRGEKKCYQLSS